MNRAEFLYKLKEKTRRLPYAEQAELLRYYEEYFNDAGPENEQEVLKSLGDPGVIAARVVGDFALKEARESPASTKKSMTALWIVLLAIFASPILLPIAAVILAILFAVVSVIFAIAVALVATVAGLFVAGLALIIAGVSNVFAATPVSLMVIGVGLALLGLTILALLLVVKLFTVAIPAIVRGFTSLLAKIFKRRKNIQQPAQAYEQPETAVHDAADDNIGEGSL